MIIRIDLEKEKPADVLQLIRYFDKRPKGRFITLYAKKLREGGYPEGRFFGEDNIRNLLDKEQKRQD